METIYCIGDSHTGLFTGDRPVVSRHPAKHKDKYKSFKVFHLGPGLAYTFAKPNTFNESLEQINDLLNSTIPEGSYVLICRGHVDCRTHIKKQSVKQNIPIIGIIKQVVDSYLSGVDVVLTKRGYKPILHLPVPFVHVDRNDREDQYHSVQLTKEANKITTLFNQEIIKRTNLPYIHLEPYIVDNNGNPIDKYFQENDGIHLTFTAIPFVLKEFERIGIKVSC